MAMEDIKCRNKGFRKKRKIVDERWAMKKEKLQKMEELKKE